ncbi:MAG: hypothetical protein J7L43_02325, partial [Candidatus Aenigmarchaeota archaeon]|nr:hypothetical protein [Candidatus Aenigmarchaeota archaeon]
MRRYEFLVLILVSLTVFSAGCVKNGSTPALGKLLEVTLDAPESVFMGENFSVYLDINNLGNKTYNAVDASFFDTDGFEKLSPCKATWDIKKKEIKILECKLRYPISNIEKSTIRNIYASVSYDGYLNSAAQLIVLSEKEYRLREKTNSLPSITNLFTKRNDELEAIVRFKDNPFIIKPAEKQTYMYIT